MPIYEYKCKGCGNIFEKLLPLRKADDVQQCPKCDNMDTFKLLTYPAGFVKKGDGFHSRN